jgi:hypothetical protein
VIIQALATVLTGLAVIAPGAHLFELPRKIGMTKDQYYGVQQIYLGWWIVGLLLPAALVADVALAIHTRGRPGFWFALAAAVLIVANLTIFWFWTRPVNVITKNWTLRRDDWQELRRQWEFSHAVNAGGTFLAFCAATIAALSTSP